MFAQARLKPCVRNFLALILSICASDYISCAIFCTDRDSCVAQMSEEKVQCHQDIADDPDEYPEGGLRAWMVVFGSWCGMLPAFGLMNTMGVFEDWLSTHQLQGRSRSSVAWIFSVYVFFLFFGGVQSGAFRCCSSCVQLADIVQGPLFDAFGLRCVLIPGSTGLVASIMILSVASGRSSYPSSQKHVRNIIHRQNTTNSCWELES